MAATGLAPTGSLLVLNRALSPGARVRLWNGTGVRAVTGAPGAHECVEIAWLEEGALSFQIGARSHDVPPETPFVVPANVEHTTTFKCFRGGAVHLSAAMLDDLACAAVPSFEGRVVRAGIVARPCRIRTLTRLLAEEAVSPEQGSSLVGDALAEALLVELLRCDAQPARRASVDARIRRAIDRIESDFAQPLGLEDIARSANMARFHFARLFRAEVGVSPYRYLLNVRLERASSALRSGRVSVSKAAFSSGFSDLGRFHRMFRGRFGCSPGAYRRDVG